MTCINILALPFKMVYTFTNCRCMYDTCTGYYTHMQRFHHSPWYHKRLHTNKKHYNIISNNLQSRENDILSK